MASSPSTPRRFAPPEVEMARPGRSSWSDEASRASLELLAETLGRSTGFAVVIVSVVDDQGLAENVAIATGGSSAGSNLLGTRIPLDLLMRNLEDAEVVGRLRFLRGEDNRLDHAWGWSPTPVELTLEGSWHPMDWLVVIVHDDAGDVVGMLQLDAPVDGLRPDRARLAEIEQRCLIACGAVAGARIRERMAARTRLALTTRDVVRGASGRQGVPAILAHCHEAVTAGLRARDLYLHLFDDEGLARTGTTYGPDGVTTDVPAPFVETAERDARAGWADQRVAIVDQEHPTGGWLSMGEGGYLLSVLDHLGLASILFAPIGVGGTCLGSLTLTRDHGEAAWSQAEVDAALDIGHDLGHAIVNARAVQREREVLEELRQLDSYKSELIATVSHELRNPLTTVSGHLEILTAERDRLPPEVERSLAAMTRGAQRMARVVEDLLLFSKVGDPSRDFRPAEVDLADVVREAAEMQESDAERAGQRVVVRLPDEAVPVRGVPEDLVGVVSNLVGNALKYSAAGATVTLEVSRGEHDVTLRCTDEGIGISEDDQAEVFREFFRSPDPEVRRRGGTGLGLAIAARIVRRHRGRLSVESRVGRGSTFTVLLPDVVEFDRVALEADREEARLTQVAREEATARMSRPPDA